MELTFFRKYAIVIKLGQLCSMQRGVLHCQYAGSSITTFYIMLGGNL